MNTQTTTTDQPENQFESTYALLIRSAEKRRNIFEVLIHPLLILGPLVAIWQFAHQPINVPAAGLGRVRCLVCDNRIGVGTENSFTLARHPAIKG